MLTDAISIYFADATLASAFVARSCVRSKVETTGGVFQMRDACELRFAATQTRPSPRNKVPAISLTKG